ncbi:MAG: type I restriction enzyme HsdR N-terminal domain-containing protein [Bacteroidales bacterium]
MIPLNLPNSTLKITLRDQKKFVWDRLRKKFVALTPEEWVRQNFIEFLINHKGYPETLMNNEIAVRLNGMNKRCDSVIFNKNGKPVVILEYKAPQILINQNVFDQIVRYNMVLQVPFLIVSNGLNHYCCEVDYLNHRCNFMQDIPTFEEIAKRVEK